MVYKSVYHFLVWDKIKSGKTVFCLDKECKVIHVINKMSVEEALSLLNTAERDAARFEFWLALEEETSTSEGT